MPAAMHSFYLRSLYIRNELARGELELAGQQLSLGDVKSDSYVVGAVNDHIVPWTTSYQATRLLGGTVRYVLSNGGHIAGIVNPPGPKAWYTVSPGPAAYPADGAEQWRAAAETRDGSWWQDWADWAGPRAGGLVPRPGWAAAVTRCSVTRPASTSTADRAELTARPREPARCELSDIGLLGKPCRCAV